MKKAEAKKDKSRNSRVKPNFENKATIGSLLWKNLKLVLQITFAVVVAIFATVVWRSTTAGIKNLMNVEKDLLVGSLQSDLPYLFYCHRGGKQETVPAYFSELNMIKGSRLGFATVNCSQILPSGKTMWEKFNLKKEWRPVIFGTAPWLPKPKQANPTHLKDVKTLGNFVDTSLAPRATEVKSDKELSSFCGFSKNFTYDERSITGTCVVLLKGTRHSKVHTDLEERLIRKHPRVKFAVIDASKRRLSFEGSDLLPADHFALKVHALRNGTHFLTMHTPITWDYLSTFVASTLATPMFDFTTTEGETIKLLKSTSSAFKDRSAPRPPSAGDSSSSPKSKDTKKSRSKKAKAADESSRTKASASVDKPDDSDKTAQSDPAAEQKKEPIITEAERIQRERARREEMERLARDHMIEEDDSDDSDATEDEEDFEEDMQEIIEL